MDKSFLVLFFKKEHLPFFQPKASGVTKRTTAAAHDPGQGRPPAKSDPPSFFQKTPLALPLRRTSNPLAEPIGMGILYQFATGGGGTGLLVFACLCGAGILSLWLHPRLSPTHRSKETHRVIRLSANMVVALTSLVLGLLIASVQSGFSGVAHDVREFATQMILLDRTLRQYGPDAAPSRVLLTDYARQAIAGTWPSSGPITVDDPKAGALLDQTQAAIMALAPVDGLHTTLKNQAMSGFNRLLTLRWTVIEDAEARLPRPFLGVMILWLALVFAGFGFNAPRNRVVVVTLVMAAGSIAAAMFPLVEMDGAFDGLIRVSPASLQQALALMTG
jgi:hypothetical protein